MNSRFRDLADQTDILIHAKIVALPIYKIYYRQQGIQNKKLEL